VHLDLSQGQFGVKLGDVMAKMMVVQLLHHSVLRFPHETTNPLTLTYWKVPKNHPENYVLSALDSFDETLKTQKGISLILILDFRPP